MNYGTQVICRCVRAATSHENGSYHDTDCGMLLFTKADLRNLLARSLKTATLNQTGWHDSGDGPGSTEDNYIDWLTFSDNAKSVVEDVMRIRPHPSFPNDIPIYGYAKT